MDGPPNAVSPKRKKEVNNRVVDGFVVDDICALEVAYPLILREPEAPGKGVDPRYCHERGSEWGCRAVPSGPCRGRTCKVVLNSPNVRHCGGDG